jgi:hypothetical protein
MLFENGRFCGSKRPFPQNKSPLNLTGRKTGQIANNVLKIQQALHMCEKQDNFSF